MPQKSNKIYYSLNDILSKECIVNAVISQRGIGKNYDWKRFCIKNFLHDGSQFMYLRRFKNELKDAGDMFEKEDIPPKYHNLDISYRSGKFYCGKEVMGYARALSTGGLYGKGIAHKRINNILFDEFTLPFNPYIRYINGEFDMLAHFIDTINRIRDESKIKNCVRLFLFGNPYASHNPIFDGYGIRINKDKRFTIYKNKGIAIEYIRDEEFAEARMNSKHGKTLIGTDYAKSAFYGLFTEDTTHFIGELTSNHILRCEINSNILFKVYSDINGKNMIVTSGNSSNTKHRYSLELIYHKPNDMFLRYPRDNYFMMLIRSCYNQNKLLFSSSKVYNKFEKCLKLIL